MRETVDLNGCDQSEALVSWLYNETTSADESKDFEQHLLSCASCRKDALAFRSIRQSIGAWRQETLGSVPQFVQPILPERTKSARAAFREFFSLSPFWMKGAIACASIVLCVLAALAIIRIKEKPRVELVMAPPPSEDFQQRVEQRAKVLATEMQSHEQQTTQVVTATVNRNRADKRQTRHATLASTEVANVWKKRRPLSPQEREQLAADLRLSPIVDDLDMELLGDGNRRER